MADPIIDVLEMIVRGSTHTACAGPSNWRNDASVAVVSYDEQSFDHLWQFPQALRDWLAAGKSPEHARTLILVWDGIVPQEEKGDGLAAEYVTATDWAVALAMKTMTGTESESPWRILVLDLSPSAASSTLTERLFQTGKALLPMVSVCRPTQFDEILGAVGEHVGAPSATDHDLVKRLWASAIAQPEDPQKRHSVSNVIGPRILLAGMRGRQEPEENNTGALAALKQMMSALDLIPEASEIQPAPWYDWQGYRQDIPRFVLIDDMAKLGWREFLEKALGVDPTQIRQCPTPDHSGFGKGKRRKILDLLRGEHGELRINKGLVLTGDENEVIDEVLFLDLRLFGQRSSTEEQAFIRSLLPLAEGAPERNGPTLPWPGFQPEEIAAVTRYLGTGKRETPDYFVALTLLPRLLALVDPRLPIILFSSTGRRAISDPLSRYENIIRDFDKPRFFGKASDTAFNLMSDRFRRAVDRALRILKGRRLWHELVAPTT